jgi:hypothetical protein
MGDPVGHYVASLDELFSAREPGWHKGDDGKWFLRLPCGHVAQLSDQHEVDEHSDVSISGLAKPGNSNLILCSCGWHGYIDHGRFYTT